MNLNERQIRACYAGLLVLTRKFPFDLDVDGEDPVNLFVSETGWQLTDKPIDAEIGLHSLVYTGLQWLRALIGARDETEARQMPNRPDNWLLPLLQVESELLSGCQEENARRFNQGEIEGLIHALNIRLLSPAR